MLEANIKHWENFAEDRLWLDVLLDREIRKYFCDAESPLEKTEERAAASKSCSWSWNQNGQKQRRKRSGPMAASKLISASGYINAYYKFHRKIQSRIEATALTYCNSKSINIRQIDKISTNQRLLLIKFRIIRHCYEFHKKH